MATTWPTVTSVAFLSGEGVETIQQVVFDRQQVLMGRGVTVPLTNTVASDGNWQLMFSFFVRAPACVIAASRIRAAAWIYQATGAETVSFKIEDSVVPTAGTTVTTTTTTPTLLESVITVPAGGWASTNREIQFYCKRVAGPAVNITCDCSRLLYNLRFGD
jgi:hypothetical protein